MQRTNYIDLKQTPEEAATATARQLLKKHPCPGYLAKEAELAS